MTNQNRSLLALALLRILKPLVRLLLRNGMAYAEFAELARHAYVEVAFEDFAIDGRKPTVSRAAVVTGLTRKEVKRLMTPIGVNEESAGRAYNRAARVVTGWVRDSEFHGDNGQPAELLLDDIPDTPSFGALVRRYSGDMPMRAVLDELARVGVVSESDDGRVRLLKRAYVPVSDNAQSLHIVGSNVGDLLETLDCNLSRGDAEPRFQRTVSYDNVPPEALAEWRRIAAERSQALLEELDRFLARYDRDVSGASPGERVRTGVGIYYFEDSMEAPRHRQQRRNPQ